MGKVKVSRAFVTNEGEVIPQSVLERYIKKAEGGESKQIKDVFDGAYGDSGLIEPLYSPELLAGMLDLNTYHYRACDTKAQDAVGLGWTLKPREESENHDERQRKAAMEFLNKPHPMLTLREIFKRAALDYEAIGYGALELVKDGSGVPVAIEHIPAHTIRRHRDGLRFAQRRAGKIVWFKHVACGMELTVDGRKERPSSPEEAANEIIYVYNYTPRSDYYGTPDVIPAMMAMLADYERAEYNADFFKHHAVPAYAVTVTGAELDEDVEDSIRQYFNTDLKNNRHSTLVMSAEKADAVDAQDVEIKFEALSVDIKEASFRLFRKDNRDEILSAHAVPPYRAGIAEEGSLGGSSAKEATEIYKQSVINPRQEMWEGIINRHILQDGFGVTDWVFDFDEIDTRDTERETKKHKEYFGMGVYTPNDILRMLGREPVEGVPAMDWHYINGRPLEKADEWGASGQGGGYGGDRMIQSVKGLHQELVAIAAKGQSDESRFRQWVRKVLRV